jgi:putative transcriptional regulator
MLNYFDVEGNKMDLTNKFLVATTKQRDKLYDNSIVYIVSYNKQQVLGVIINKKFNNILSETLCNIGYNLNIEQLVPDYVHFGGHNNLDKSFLLYLDGDKNQYDIINDDFNHNLDNKNYLIIMGQIIWHMDELEQQIINGEWLVTNANDKIIYDQEDYSKINTLIKNMGAKNMCFFDWNTNETVQ